MGGLAVCIGLGCATTQVRTAHDPSAKFDRYRTFALSRGQIINDGRVDQRDTLVRDRFDTAVRQALSAKGLQPTKVNPDLIVTYAADARTIEKLTPSYESTYANEISYAPVPVPWLSPTRQGTLVIALIDAGTNKVVWRSVAQSEGGNPRKPENIEKAVDKALEKFPAPRAG
jgi:uncharacterized protein DUF4136